MKERKEITLNVGDIVFAESRHHGLSKVKITRVTKTQAMYKKNNHVGNPYETKIYRTFLGSTTEIAATGWHKTSYYAFNDELEKKYNHQQMKRKVELAFKHVVLNKASIDQLKELFELLKTFPKNQ